MSDFKDHFSGHATIYREARPTYPPELFAWLAQQTPDRELVWDVGCGNGQASVALAEHFARVIATDPSANQIAGAERRANIDYRVESGEHSSLAAASASLVTVAQALHWFDFDPFYAEVKRVLKPGGVFAAWTYASCKTGEPAVDALIDRLYGDEITGPYWPYERTHVEAGYRTLPFPFAEMTVPEFPMLVHWNVDQLLAYLRSWSASQRYLKAKGVDPVSLVEDELRAAWGDAVHVRAVRWQFYVRAGKAA